MKYLIIPAVLVTVLLSFSLLYVDNSPLVDSLRRFPVHLGEAGINVQTNTGHTFNTLTENGSNGIMLSKNRVLDGGDDDSTIRMEIWRHPIGRHFVSVTSYRASGNSRGSREVPFNGNQQPAAMSSHNYLLSSLCSDPLCTQFLSEKDLANFTACKKRTETAFSKMLARQKIEQVDSFSPVSHKTTRFSHGLLQASGECRFMNGSGRSPVGLVSFPGSGNTWVRGLLQKATTICTGESHTLVLQEVPFKYCVPRYQHWYFLCEVLRQSIILH